MTPNDSEVLNFFLDFLKNFPKPRVRGKLQTSYRIFRVDFLYARIYERSGKKTATV